MKKFVLTFKNRNMQELKDFAEKASKTESGVTIFSGKSYFDASSFMSLIAVKDSDKITVCYSERDMDFENYLNTFF